MPADLEGALRAQFGFDAFRAGQREAILAALENRDALVVMPTGSGKSLCYQLSAFVLPTTTLVISPLIALMKDQVDNLIARGKRAALINSTLSAEDQRSRLAILARGWYKIIYVAPERLRNAEFLAAIKQTRVSLIAVDEAHCISQWGHDFRPDYMHIREFAKAIGRPPVIALTATATPQVQDDIVARLSLREPARIVTGFNRPNLALNVRYTPSDEDKLRELEKNLRAANGSVIIYAGTRRKTEEIAEHCKTIWKIPAQQYHAGMTDAMRTQVQDAFMNGHTRVIVATNAFGMGVDKSNIRAVIHYNMPSNIEAYYQEIGRAGRDGEPARGILLYSPNDRDLQEWFIENDAPEPSQVLLLHAALVRLAGKSPLWLTPFSLQRQSKMDDTKLRLALQQLERVEVIDRIGDAGGKIGIQVLSDVPPDLTVCAADIERLRAHKRRLLARMIAYAETNQCRRRYILDYFGDKGDADAPDCCDNHANTQPRIAPTATETASSLAHTLLACVKAFDKKLGRTSITQVLTGSRAQTVQKFSANPFFGQLRQFQRKQLDSVLDGLIAQGFVKVIGGKYPVATLTPQGQAALKSNAPIEVDTPNAQPTVRTLDKESAERAGGTLELTLELAQQGLMPPEIARKRGMSIVTIYGHLEKLIRRGDVQPDSFVSADVRKEIIGAMRGWDGKWLAELKQRLPEKISYEQIRLTIAAQRGEKPVDAPRPLWSSRYEFDSSNANGAPLVERVTEFIRAHPDLSADVIVLIPLSGKNRATTSLSILARAIAPRLRVPLNEYALTHVRGENQTSILRALNSNTVRGKRILLIDDSDESLKNATRVLLDAGANEVRVLTIHARGDLTDS